MFKRMRLPATLLLAMLSAGCGPAPDRQADSPSPTAKTDPPRATPPADTFDENRAMDLLQARLAADHAYPDLPCLGYAIEDEQDEAASATASAPAAPKASAPAAIEIAVREKHGDGCPGDPQTEPVRDRFRVERSGAIRWYDVVDGDFVDYAQWRQQQTGGGLP
ncbi:MULTISPECIES: hypothetical protein [unclassified Xanthomonas]|uniref:hypothetical protein n=1 Tax=unclassified Xanthomonas TaxID=2643310 RepID=UPI001368206B|nr:MULTISPECIES: hypothetical protein [unclassified Xanthomonas]MBB5876794.1 uncharacterized protein involved in copper resistance [Xanthomonas sp. 3498]MXV06596.1 hypothetical protein [Xanthomonas sp. LMG 9002]